MTDRLLSADREREDVADALRTALSVALHEHFDPECSGKPVYDETQAVAEGLVDAVMRMPLVRAALSSPETTPAGVAIDAMAEALNNLDLALDHEHPQGETCAVCQIAAVLPVRWLAVLDSFAATPAGVLDEAALAKALDALGPGTIADLAWSPNKHEWRDGYWAAVHDGDFPAEDDYPMASLAHALAAALGRSGSGR